jgi:glycosyltransferase involved in cell wall biosynthesis
MPIDDCFISVLICSKGRSIDEVFPHLIQIKENLNYSKSEVILVDGNEDQALKNVAAAIGLNYVFEPRDGIATARNSGIEASRGDVIAFTDDDCIIEVDWAKRIAQHFINDRELDGLGGVDLTPKTASPLQKVMGIVDDLSRNSGRGHWAAYRMKNCNCAYRKASIVKYGKYDPSFMRAGEDYELNLRLYECGCNLDFDNSLVVYHERISSFQNCWRKFYGYGYWSFKVFSKHPAEFLKTVDVLPQITIYIGIAFIFLLFTLSPVPLVVLLTLVTGYLGFWTLRCVRFKRELLKYSFHIFSMLVIRNLAQGLGFHHGCLGTIRRKSSRS